MRPCLSDEQWKNIKNLLNIALPEEVGYALIVFPKDGPDQHGPCGPNSRMTAGFTTTTEWANAASMMEKMAVQIRTVAASQ